MDPFLSVHRTSRLFEELAAQLRIEADHAIAAEWQQAWQGRNRIPHNRLFLVEGPAEAGSIRWGNNKHIEMHAGIYYHMPPGITLDFNFVQGLRMVAFHYDCMLGSSIDLCAGIQDVSAVPGDKKFISDMAAQLHALHTPGDLMNTQAVLIRLAAQFVPGNLQELAEQQRIAQRYAAVNEEIDLSGAATRIAAIAEIMNLTVDQLSKRFRRDLGMPLKHYIDQVVSKRAAQLLRHTDKKIKDIAEELNFRDEFTFSRFVRKHLHLNPRRYRALSDLERV